MKLASGQEQLGLCPHVHMSRALLCTHMGSTTRVGLLSVADTLASSYIVGPVRCTC